MDRGPQNSGYHLRDFRVCACALYGACWWCRVFPSGSNWAFVNFPRALDALPRMSPRSWRRVARARAAKPSKKSARKRKSRSSFMLQGVGTQVVTEFCGPLDNGQRSTKFWLPPARFSCMRARVVRRVLVVSCVPRWVQLGFCEFSSRP